MREAEEVVMAAASLAGQVHRHRCPHRPEASRRREEGASRGRLGPTWGDEGGARRVDPRRRYRR